MIHEALTRAAALTDIYDRCAYRPMAVHAERSPRGFLLTYGEPSECGLNWLGTYCSAGMTRTYFKRMVEEDWDHMGLGA